MGLLDVLRGVESEENIGEEEEQEDIGGSQEREEQRAGLLGGLFNNLKEFVGVEDDDDAEPPPIEAEGTGTEMHLNAINAPEEFDFLPVRHTCGLAYLSDSTPHRSHASSRSMHSCSRTEWASLLCATGIVVTLTRTTHGMVAGLLHHAAKGGDPAAVGAG